MSRSQCPRCLRPESHCLCALIPQLDSRTRVLLLQHPSEVNHALNTARLAALGLTTHISAVRAAGTRPLVLAALLFAWLLGAGLLLNLWLPSMFA